MAADPLARQTFILCIFLLKSLVTSVGDGDDGTRPRITQASQEVISALPICTDTEGSGLRRCNKGGSPLAARTNHPPVRDSLNAESISLFPPTSLPLLQAVSDKALQDF